MWALVVHLIISLLWQVRHWYYAYLTAVYNVFTKIHCDSSLKQKVVDIEGINVEQQDRILVFVEQTFILITWSPFHWLSNYQVLYGTKGKKTLTEPLTVGCVLLPRYFAKWVAVAHSVM